MLRRVLIASMTSWLLFSCGDDDAEPPLEGKGGSNQGGGKASGGTAGRGGAAGTQAGEAGADVGSGGISSGGISNGGTSSGGTEPGSGGSTPSAGSGGEDTIEGGTSGAGGEPGGGTTSKGGTTGTGGSSGGTTNKGGTTGTSGGTTSFGGITGVDGGFGGEGGDDPIAGAGGDGSLSPRGLVAHFSFDENTGTTAADKSGYFGPASLANGASWTPGRAGTSGVNLADTTSHVVLPNKLFATAEKATVAAWVNLATYNPWSRIWDINADLTKFAFLASDRGDAGPRLDVHIVDGAQDGTIGTPGRLPLNVWKHVAVTVDGANYKMYIDGYPTQSVVTKPRTPKEVEPSAAGWLGRSTFNVDPYLKAKLDDFRVYDGALTQPEIADLAWPDSDYAYLRLDEKSGTTAADSSNLDRDGTLLGGVTFVDGQVGGAIKLTAANSQYVALPPTLLSTCDDVTVSIWAKLDTHDNWSRFLDIDGLVNGFMYFSPAIDVSGQKQLGFLISRPGQTPPDQGVVAPYPTGVTVAGGWHHFAFTRSGTTGRLYFDGLEIGSNTAMTYKPSDITIATSGAPHAWLGRSTFNTDPYLNGSLDEVRISCRAFTADEIRQLSR